MHKITDAGLSVSNDVDTIGASRRAVDNGEEYMSRSGRTKSAAGGLAQRRAQGGDTTGARQVSVWEDDPETGVQVARPLPDPSKGPLACDFPAKAPAPGRRTGTP